MLPKMPEEVALFVRDAFICLPFMLLHNGRLLSDSWSLITAGAFSARIPVTSHSADSACDLISLITTSLSISKIPIWHHVNKAASRPDLAARASASSLCPRPPGSMIGPSNRLRVTRALRCRAYADIS
jgi:hypothetical protein